MRPQRPGVSCCPWTSMRREGEGGGTESPPDGLRCPHRRTPRHPRHTMAEQAALLVVTCTPRGWTGVSPTSWAPWRARPLTPWCVPRPTTPWQSSSASAPPPSCSAPHPRGRRPQSPARLQTPRCPSPSKAPGLMQTRPCSSSRPPWRRPPWRRSHAACLCEGLGLRVAQSCLRAPASETLLCLCGRAAGEGPLAPHIWDPISSATNRPEAEATPGGPDCRDLISSCDS